MKPSHRPEDIRHRSALTQLRYQLALAACIALAISAGWLLLQR